jgi:L-fuconolactonase
MGWAMRIDAHQHFWRLSRGDYGWLDASLAPIHRDFGPEDLEPLLKQTGVDRTILIQAAPTPEETDFILALAQATPFVAGVVGWADFEAPETARRIAELAKQPKLVGLRPMIQDLPQTDWMLGPAIQPAIEAMIATGLRFDALIKPVHLPVLLAFARRYPGLRIVVDHAGKPNIAGGEHHGWAGSIQALAGEPNIVCKLSGLVTEAGPNPTPADLRPYVDTLLAAFGPKRLMWGSDWPVLNLNGDYAGWRGGAEALLAGLSIDERECVFGEAAQAFYGV